MGDTELTRMTKQQLAAELHRAEALTRHGQSRSAEVLAEMHARGTLAEYGYGDLATLQVDLLHISRREARKRATRALALHPRVGIAGAEIPALAPRTAEAFATGSIAAEHVDEIVATLAEVPTPAAETIEHTLVELAVQADPLAVRKAGRHALACLNPDGPEPVDNELARPERELYVQLRRDGRYGLTGILDQETGHLLETLLSPLSKPRPAADGTRDPRSPQQRLGDGFADLIELVHRAVERPTEGGERPTIVVTMTLEQITGPAAGTRIQDGRPVLADGTPITVEHARRLACDAQMIPAVLGGPSETLDLGRSQRTASPHQRRMLRLRDKGCVKCGRSARWCHVHHVNPWDPDGDTDIDNLCLLCSECHRLVHHAGWQIIMNRNGTPQAVPPDWIANLATGPPESRAA